MDILVKPYPKCNLEETIFNKLKEKKEIDIIQLIGHNFLKDKILLDNTEMIKKLNHFKKQENNS